MRSAGLSLLSVVLALVTSQAGAHDSWLSPASTQAPGQVTLELSTGNRYPVQEFGSAAANVARAACGDGAGPEQPLRPLREHPKWLELSVGSSDAAQGPIACWLELKASEIELAPPLVQVYLAEIRAPAATRQARAEQQQRGLAWRERYRKFARIELADAAASPAMLAAARQPVGLDLEIVVRGERPIAAGEPLEFQVLRNGRPLAGFAVELVSERSAFGIWRDTDARGVLRHRLPFAGRWLLRGTDLRASEDRLGEWDSRFVTLAIEAR
jgi:hypothetical protein